ncbi:unnamed protein product [Nippostrongylus brasiliensis]|uniref:Mortality factor 4-like protein 2 n=1 Tax=Nippostrongylus brasiliensis TaxID=27835 RepID=A0A0N4Y9E6_NIPBR|nr:unnamed protein product [Nippostrongylus brasiliensis]
MDSSASTPDPSEKSAMEEKNDAVVNSAGRKRGRPRKNAATTGAAPAVNNTDSPATPKKRGRKSTTEVANAGSETMSSPASPSSEKRGRPSTWAYAEYSDGSEYDEDEVKMRKKPKSKPATTPARVEEIATDAQNNGDSKGSSSPSDNEDDHSENKQASEKSVMSEKRRRGRPRKGDKLDQSERSDNNAEPSGRYTVPLPVPDSWPLVNNREDIMKEISEMYTNVKDEKIGEFHNQIKAFVFALHWV